MTLIFKGHTFKYKTESLVKLFFPATKIELEYESTVLDRDEIAVTRLKKGRTKTTLLALVKLHGKQAARHEFVSNSDADYEKKCERLLCRALYQSFCTVLSTTLSWGTLTGVRPVKMVNTLHEQGMDNKQVAAFMQENYLVSDEKMHLCMQTAMVQSALPPPKENAFSLYISIPFCPSRCSYCSFVSQSIANPSARTLVDDYVTTLCKELIFTAALIKPFHQTLETIYFGGGTPTALEADHLKILTDCVAQHFDVGTAAEYTVEAGRADTITKEKLLVLKAAGVTRISINPQTFDDSVLRAVGRLHTAEDVIRVFHLARETGFDCINMDLIAGLPGDTLAGFRHSLDTAVGLGSENITVHTLSIKRSSDYFTLDGLGDTLRNNDVQSMVSYAREQLMRSGYRPYYLYRQKNMIDNLENVGYAKPGFESPYNIYIMEENHTILAAGANGVTKLVDAGEITRVFNYKFPYEYISRFEQMQTKKQGVVDFYGRQSKKSGGNT